MAQGRKTGGRQKGTPNKPSPLKEHIRSLSTVYFQPRPQTNPDGTPRTIEFRDKDGALYNSIRLADVNGQPLVISDFEIDTMQMDAKDRAAIHERLLRYHMPQMQSVSAEVSLSGEVTTTIEQRLAELAAQNDQ